MQLNVYCSKSKCCNRSGAASVASARHPCSLCTRSLFIFLLSWRFPFLFRPCARFPNPRPFLPLELPAALEVSLSLPLPFRMFYDGPRHSVYTLAIPQALAEKTHVRKNNSVIISLPSTRRNQASSSPLSSSSPPYHITICISLLSGSATRKSCREKHIVRQPPSPHSKQRKTYCPVDKVK